ncbi:MAG TPA: PAS domain S-box protein [Pyrinomonadaceae bacterium]|nr:PAS domain S-box protein [Pyrinomonadaceae bacterium]
MKTLADNPATVLIVNDDQSQLDLLRDLLEPEGHKVFVAQDGQSALDVTRSLQVEIVISEVVMPHIDGMELCRLLKKNPHTAAIPVLLTSGIRKEEAALLEGFEAGADDYLEIPFRHEELLVKVARLIERHRVERRYRDIVEQAADIIYTRDMDGYIRSINQAGARFFGRPAFELIGKPLSLLIGEEAAARDIAEMKQVQSRDPIRFTDCLKNALGEERHLEAIVTIERDSQGNSVAIRGVVRDVTDRRFAQAAVIESEERYRELIENANDIIYTHDLKGNFTSLNKVGELITGYSCEEALTMNIVDVLAPSSLEVARHMLARKAEEKIATIYELDIFAKNGRRLALEVSTRLIYSAGNPVGVQGMARDITGRKAAEAALKDSEEKFRSIVETTNEWIWAIDVQGNYNYTNPAISYILGYRPDEILNANVFTYLHPEDRAELQVLLPQLMKEQRGWAGRILRWKHKHNGYRYLESNGVPVFDSDNNLTGYRGADRDITARRRMELERGSIFEIVQGVITTPTLDDLLRLVHRSISKVLYAENCFVALLDPATNTLHFEFWLDKKDATPPPLPVGRKGFASHVLQTGQPLLLTEELTQQMIDRGEVEQSGSSAASWLGVPLRTESLTMGVLVVQHYEDENAYSQQDLELLTSIASQTALAIEQKRAQGQLHQQAERVAVTNRISQAVRRTLDVSDVFQTAVRELGQHLEVDRCSLYMERTGRVVAAAEYHVPDVGPALTDFDFPQLESLSSAIEKFGTLAFDDVRNDERIRPAYEQFLMKMDVKSIMYVGVMVDDELLGVFALSTTKELHRWTDSDIEVAKAVADQTGIAVRQARLYEKAEATSMREALVNKLSIAIRASLSLTDVLNTASNELGQVLSASRVRVRLFDATGKTSSPVSEYVAAGYENLDSFDDEYEISLRAHFLVQQDPLVINDAHKLPEGGADFAERVRAHALLTGQRSHIECPLTVNGEFRGVITAERIRRWAEDEVLLVKSVAAQLGTGIAQAELFEMVAQAKMQWESTFDAMSDGIFIFDGEGHLVRVNRAGAAMDKAPPESLLGKQCCDILRTENGTGCIVEQALRQSVSINTEIVPVHLDRPVLVTVESILDERSQTIGAVATARDLSELRKVEAVARERQSLLQNIMESAREAIYAMDLEGNYKWCNQAMLEMTGYSLEEIIGHSFLERTHEEDREMRLERFAKAISGEAQSFETRYIASDGKVRYAAINTAPIVVDGETTGVLGIAHDITEQKEERDRAARADKLRALGQLASGVAHDFNNSLAAILGRAQLILRRVKDEELLRSLGIIVTAAEDAAATVRRIQTFARKSVATELEMLDVGNLMRDAIEFTRTRWQNEALAAGIDINVTLQADPECFTLGNASELREVFVNLIVNAVDAMPNGGSLKLCCRREDDRIKLRFADTGTGIKEEIRERIFEPFYTTKGVHGTGLGLAVSYGIIERHGGMISVESQLGKGSIFNIDLPFVQQHREKNNAAEGTASMKPLSILVIDDEEFVRETLGEILAALTHEVQTVDSGRAALEKIATSQFDVVFTDLAMPEMDGWETARAIRKTNPNLPVVLVTGYGATAEAPAGEQNLVDAIIGKPFAFDQVTAVLAKVCSEAEVEIEEPVLMAQ